MRSTTTGQPGTVEAWREYRSAFQQFSQRARKVQLLTTQPNPDRAAIDAALLELEKARLAYNRRRNVLAAQLLCSPSNDKCLARMTDTSQPQAERVKHIAKLVWEFSGRPEGTADTDWQRAEEIIRLAAA